MLREEKKHYYVLSIRFACLCCWSIVGVPSRVSMLYSFYSRLHTKCKNTRRHMWFHEHMHGKRQHKKTSTSTESDAFCFQLIFSLRSNRLLFAHVLPILFLFCFFLCVDPISTTLTLTFIRAQNFRLHHNDLHVKQCFEVHRINRMFNNSNASNGGGDGDGGDGSKIDQSNLNNNNKRNEHNHRNATNKGVNADDNGVGADEEIPNDNHKSPLDKNSNREIFTMDSLNRNSLSGTWWVIRWHSELFLKLREKSIFLWVLYVRSYLFSDELVSGVEPAHVADCEISLRRMN